MASPECTLEELAYRKVENINQPCSDVDVWCLKCNGGHASVCKSYDRDHVLQTYVSQTFGKDCIENPLTDI